MTARVLGPLGYQPLGLWAPIVSIPPSLAPPEFLGPRNYECEWFAIPVVMGANKYGPLELWPPTFLGPYGYQPHGYGLL